MIRCPKCGSIDIKPIGDTHYICNNENCNKDKLTQFRVIYDKIKEVPYNHIFEKRDIKEFFKLPYLENIKLGNE